MPAKEMLTKQFGYNNWANGRILEKAALLSEDQLQAASVVEGRSLHEILVHLVRVEKVWRLLAQSGSLDPAQMPNSRSLATFQAIQAFQAGESQAMGAYLAELDEEALAEALLITRWDGVKHEMTRWTMLSHTLMHSMQHRSEAAVLLTQYGQSPGDIDFLFYLI